MHAPKNPRIVAGELRERTVSTGSDGLSLSALANLQVAPVEYPYDWYVSTIRPMMSRVAETNLSRQGFVSLFPRITSEGHTVELFPGYGFVQFAIKDPFSGWQSIRNTRGISGLLPLISEHPRAIPAGFVDELMLRLAHVDDDTSDAPREHHYIENETVYVMSGPLMGSYGRYVGLRNKGWASIEISMFGSPIKAVVKLHQIRPTASN